MEVCIGDNKVVVTTETEVIHFDLPKNVSNIMYHDIYFIINTIIFK